MRETGVIKFTIIRNLTKTQNHQMLGRQVGLGISSWLEFESTTMKTMSTCQILPKDYLFRVDTAKCSPSWVRCRCLDTRNSL